MIICLDKINYTVFPARLKTNLDAGKGISFNEDEVIIDIPLSEKNDCKESYLISGRTSYKCDC